MRMEHHSLFGKDMPVFGKNHGNQKCRTLSGLSGFYTVSGHFVNRAWGRQGSSLCGQTINFESDPITREVTVMAKCCSNRYHRIARKLNTLNRARVKG